MVVINYLSPNFKLKLTIEEDCLSLADFGVNVRYPFQLDVIESDMKKALQNAYKIKEYVLEKANK